MQRNIANRKAKKRMDYIFKAELVEYYRNELIVGEFDTWDDYHSAKDGRFERGTALLELGWCDIELNINSAADDHGGYINKTVPTYFICVKGKTEEGDEDWSPSGYIDDFGYEVNVDWSADNWKELLEKDMFENLMKAVKRFDIKIDEPNWKGESHAFDVFDRFMELANHKTCRSQIDQN